MVSIGDRAVDLVKGHVSRGAVATRVVAQILNARVGIGRAEECVQPGVVSGVVLRLRLAEAGVRANEQIAGVENRHLLEILEHHREGAVVFPFVGPGRRAGVGGRIQLRSSTHRKRVVCREVIVQGQTDLLQVVRALNAPGRLARRLHGREQERDQHRDDGDDHQQLDQSEAFLGTAKHALPFV